jgi:hypothetical protein
MGMLMGRAISLLAPVTVTQPHRAESSLLAATVLGMARAQTSRESHLSEELNVNSRIRTSILIVLLIVTSALSATYAIANKRHPEHFLPEERRIISEYYRRANTTKKGLPPGLAKRGGKLPPGLQKHLEKNGQLPPGLQKRLEPLPSALDGRLPSIPEYWERVLVERDVILLDRRTNRILDIIENVIGLASGQ